MKTAPAALPATIFNLQTKSKMPKISYGMCNHSQSIECAVITMITFSVMLNSSFQNNNSRIIKHFQLAHANKRYIRSSQQISLNKLPSQPSH